MTVVDHEGVEHHAHATIDAFEHDIHVWVDFGASSLPTSPYDAPVDFRLARASMGDAIEYPETVLSLS